MEMYGSPGLHHAILYAGRGPFIEQEIDCFGLPEESMELVRRPSLVFASSTQVQRQSSALPPGVAIELDEITHFIINHHWLNATGAPIDTALTLDLSTLPDGEEAIPARSFSFGAVTGIQVPPRGAQTLTTTCRFLQDATIASLTPHMHRAGVSFGVQRHDGERPQESLLAVQGWNNPETLQLAPPLALRMGEGLTFTCTWQNLSAQTLRFGPRSSDEMCFVFGYYFPAKQDLLSLDATGACKTEAVE
jgi:hypothetical protein